ncbi:MAG: hypothetical protein KDD67_15925 [Ignavibacteriae bacterium]|nr:hypothetical protein [Ignavibacteriota bacterium]MCB9215689.1 hypothetical protein [Ignavibacteria bacterium]
MKPVIYRILSWLIYLFVVGVFTVGGFFAGAAYERDRKSFGHSDIPSFTSSLSSPRTYEDYMQGVARIESQNPLDFLKIKNMHVNTGLFSSNVTIECRVDNWAMQTGYKDFQFEVSCLSKTQSVIDRIQKTVYEVIPARSQRALRVNFSSPPETKEYTVHLLRAVPARTE